MFTCQVGGNKVFLLVQISYSGFWGFLHDYLKINIEKQIQQHVLSTVDRVYVPLSEKAKRPFMKWDVSNRQSLLFPWKLICEYDRISVYNSDPGFVEECPRSMK